MKKFIRFTIALVMGIIAFGFQSCDNSNKKYEYLSKQIPATFATVDAVGASSMSPANFSKYMEVDFDKIQTQRVDDGVAVVYEWKKDGKYTLGEDERFDCCALFDYNRNPTEPTISNIAIRYTSSSADDLDKFYSTAMSELEPLMTNWGFKLNEQLQKPTCKYYLKGNEVITISKDNQEVTFTKIYR